MIVNIKYESDNELDARLATTVYCVLSAALPEIHVVEDTPLGSRFSYIIFNSKRRKRNTKHFVKVGEKNGNMRQIQGMA